MKKSAKYLKLILRWPLRLLLGLFLLFLLVTILLQFPPVQTRVSQSVISRFSSRTGTEMSLQKISIRIPFGIGIRGLYVEDTKGDTLFYAGNVKVDVNMFALLSNRIKVSNVFLGEIVANITRLEPDTVYSYAFIINSLSGKEKDPGPANQKEKESAHWSFELGKLEIRNARARFADYFSGIDLQSSIGGFSTSVENFNPADFSYYLGNTAIKDTRIALALNEPARPSEDTEIEPTEMDLGLRQLEVDGFTFDLNSHKGQALHTNINQLLILSRKLDITRQQIEIEKFSLDGLLVEMKLTETEGDAQEVADQLSEAAGFRWAENFDWFFLADKLELRNAEVAISTLGATSMANTFVAGNFRFSDLEFLAENLQITPEIIKLRLENMRARSGNDFQLNRLAADIELGDVLRITNLNLETGLSLLQGDINAGVSPLQFPLKNIEKAPINLNISRGRIGTDLAFFAPGLRDYFHAADRVLFAAKASGTTSNLLIDTLWAEGPGVFTFALGGNVKNLFDIENLELAVPQALLTASPKKIRRFIPQNQLPENLAFPDSIKLVASAKGNMRQMLASIDLSSSFGGMFMDATFTDLMADNPGYEMQLQLAGFDPGKLLAQEEMLGPVSALIDAKGTGLDPESLTARFNLLVSQAWVYGYEYKDLNVNGEIAAGVMNATIDYLDEHLGLKATNRIAFASEQPHIIANWQITHLNPHALKFTDDEFIIRTELTTDLKLTQPLFAEGSLQLRNTQVLSGQDLFALDKLELTSGFSDNLYLLNAASPLFNLAFRGSASPLEMPEMLASHFASLMGTEPDTLSAEAAKGSFEFEAEILPSPWFTELLLPDLSFFEPIVFSGNFYGERSELSLKAGLPLLHYGNLTFKGFSLDADSWAGAAYVTARLPLLEGDGFQIRDFTLDALFRDSQLTFSLAFSDREDAQWLNLSGRLRREGEVFHFSLNEDLLINREPWKVATDNQIAFGKEILKVTNFRLGQNDQYLFAQSREEEDGFAPLDISFSRFDIGQFFAYDDKPIAGGTLHGDITFNQMFNGLAFLSDLSIDRFSFRGDTIGDIHVLASNPQPDQYSLKALVSGFGNEVEVEGTYRTGDQADMDVELRLRELNLSTVEGFTAGQLTDLQGQLTGSLRARGSPASPAINGSLRLNQAAFRVELINAPYRILDGQINFDRNIIRFQNFTLLDSLGRSATLAGSLNISDFANPAFNLNLNSRNFLLMNVPEGQNELFSGRMFIDSDLSLRGNLTSPVVEGRLKLNQGSFFTLIVPQTVPEAIGDDGVVEFVSLRDTLFLGMAHAAQPDPLISAFRNLNMSVNVEIDPQTDVKVIIDEYAGDYLQVKGGGMLSYGIDPGGRISLSGRYEITDGSYLLTFYDVVSRNFQIQRGSSIVLTGDPMQALVDITAIYSLRTSARELFESPIAGTTVDPALRQQYPFQVFLKMRGELLNPEISFEIGLPEANQNAMNGRLQSRLNELSRNESELNKQVFALLLLGHFVQENPLASMGGVGGFSTTARNSASRILSQQLNRISDQVIRGIDLNFEIESYEDFTSGEAAGRTELQVEVSRNFFDERLRLTLGGNIELEDETRRQTKPGEIAGDFLLEYLLNPQGSLILRGFRKKDFRDLFDGEVIQTGVSLLLTRSYNQLRELFMKKEESTELTPDENDEFDENDE